MASNGIKITHRGDFKVIEVDVNLAKYQGIVWKELSEFQKRKYENYLVLSNNTKEPIKFIYA